MLKYTFMLSVNVENCQGGRPDHEVFSPVKLSGRPPYLNFACMTCMPPEYSAQAG